MDDTSLLTCPQRYILQVLHPIFDPFGNTLANNVLKGLDGSEPSVKDDGTGLNVCIVVSN